jgi:trans-2,3-dihydro-3-hydroxyanthranilate isomerase
MSERRFYIVDVFAETRFAGNQLAVFRDGNSYRETEMQQIAKEMNFSETTFIDSDELRNGGYDVRIFTPAEEVPFAGHPTLGTAYIIIREIIGESVPSVVLNLTVGQIPVEAVYKEGELDTLWMTQKPPQFGRTFPVAETAFALGLEGDDIDPDIPILEVSTGLPFMIVPIKTLEAIKKARVRREDFFRLVAESDAKAALLFCPQTYREENDLNVRVFVDFFNIPEDPATGSANGCLAGYLVKHDYFGSSSVNVRVEQGYEIGRPSLLLLKARERDGEIEVRVGGKVFMVAEAALKNS